MAARKKKQTSKQTSKPKPKLKSVPNADELVQKEIDEDVQDAVSDAMAGADQRPAGPATHILVPIPSANQMIPFFHGQGGDMAKGFAAVLNSSKAVRVETDPEPEA